ncbi:lipoyl domain-containing protein [Nocardia crassostreae]|uniref:lipoyl domain-containing protein n=1 Tax=Nocardia crassostreae TaxID=53428 RepID=UPI00082D7B60|nr:lipoyl domain-containing protein [Nocardia crassostreae]
MNTHPAVVPVPALGHGLDEALLIEWRAAVGARVRRGDLVAVLETDKAAVDIVAERSGSIAAHCAAARSIVRPGQPLYRLAADSSTEESGAQ